MTTPDDRPLTLPASQPERIRDLLCIAEPLRGALRARGQRGDTTTLASLEELAHLLGGGGGAAQLISDLIDAHLELTSMMLARSLR